MPLCVPHTLALQHEHFKHRHAGLITTQQSTCTKPVKQSCTSTSASKARLPADEKIGPYIHLKRPPSVSVDLHSKSIQQCSIPVHTFAPRYNASIDSRISTWLTVTSQQAFSELIMLQHAKTPSRLKSRAGGAESLPSAMLHSRTSKHSIDSLKFLGAAQELEKHRPLDRTATKPK